MGNCLVTKLKANVQNDSLDVLSALTLRIKQTNDIQPYQQCFYFQPEIGKTLTITAKNGGYMATTFAGLSEPSERFTSRTFEYNPNLSYSVIYVANDNYNIEISEKYNIGKLVFGSDGNRTSIISMSIDSLEYCTYIYDLIVEFDNISGSINNLKNLQNLNRLMLSSTNINGDISSLSSLINLTFLKLDRSNISGNIEGITELSNVKTFYGNSNITGNIISFAKWASLVYVNMYNTSISGAVEDFVQSQKNNGRTTVSPGTINMPGLLMKCSLGNNLYPHEDSHTLVSWDNNKIVLYCGKPNYMDCPKIYAKGATAEEISEWRNAGKTVIEID